MLSVPRLGEQRDHPADPCLIYGILVIPRPFGSVFNLAHGVDGCVDRSVNIRNAADEWEVHLWTVDLGPRIVADTVP